MHRAGQKRALPQIHPALVEGVQPQKQPVQRVHQGGGELARAAVGVHQTPVALPTQEHVEQLLYPRTGTQPHQGVTEEEHEIWQIVVVKRIGIVEDHPFSWRELAVVQSQQIAVDLASDRVIVLEPRMKALDALVDALLRVISLASKPRPPQDQTFEGSDDVAGGG